MSAYSKFFSLIAKAALTLLAFWLVFRGVDLAQLRRMAVGQARGPVAVAALFIAAQIALGGLRWRLILAALADRDLAMMSRKEAFRIYYISVFFNCCLPGTVGGDVVRVWLAKSDHMPLPLAIHSVIIDRVIALLGLMFMVAATLPLLLPGMGRPAFGALPLLAAGLALGLWVVWHAERLLSRVAGFRLVRWLLYFTGSLKLLLAHRRASVVSLFYAVVSHGCYCAAAYALAQSLGLELTWLQCLTLIPPVALLSTLPISIGGWGVREAAMVGMLSPAGVGQAGALMLSVQMGLLVVVTSLPGGLLWLVRKGSGFGIQDSGKGGS